MKSVSKILQGWGNGVERGNEISILNDLSGIEEKLREREREREREKEKERERGGRRNK